MDYGKQYLWKTQEDKEDFSGKKKKKKDWNSE